MKEKRKSVKTILIITIALMLFSSLFMFAGCTHKAKYYTVEEHTQRVRERMEKRMEKPYYESFTGFEVYPLYDVNDKLGFFLIELEPYGFSFVLIRDEYWQLTSWSSMYRIDHSGYEQETWSPYTRDETNSQPEPDTDKIWMVDENNEKICYDRSPYYVTNNLNEKKYLLRTDEGGYVCAIKSGEKFINLVSLTEFEVTNGKAPGKEPRLSIGFIPKEAFAL